ncbi:MAG: VOC family protein [Candidatus Thorarchaeota archaeon]
MIDNFDELVKHDRIYFEIKVQDLNRSKKFYHDTFGLEVFNDAGEEVGWCSMCLPVPGTQLALQQVSEFDQQKRSAALVFSVFDIEATESYLKRKGIDTGPIVDIPNMVSLLIINDPDENEICFASPPRVKRS